MIPRKKCLQFEFPKQDALITSVFTRKPVEVESEVDGIKSTIADQVSKMFPIEDAEERWTRVLRHLHIGNILLLYTYF